MKGTNTWHGSGNVASDVQYGTTSTGDAAANFKLAIEQIHKNVVFVRINVYGGNVEVCKSREVKKGDYVIVEGELMNRKTTERDETITEIRCRSVVIAPPGTPRRGQNG